ncbi:MAG: hypothetical protein ACM3WU_03055 [Bacillota bacterium]
MDRMRIDELDVERINVIDKDGKVRMAISGSSKSPGWVIGGKVVPGRPKHAGIIFYNDDGVECGGLIYGNGMMSLTIDQKDQDQVVGLQYDETEDGKRWYGLTVWDRPDVPLADMIDEFAHVRATPDGPERAAAWKALSEKYPSPERLFAGKLSDGSVTVRLRDSRGRERLRLSISSDDQPEVTMLDEEGKTVWSASRSAEETGVDVPHQEQMPSA